MALPSDLTDGAWAVLEPLLPFSLPFGRPRKWPLRRLVEAILYLLRGGVPWRMLPRDFPPKTTVQRYFHAWRDAGLRQKINACLLAGLRVAGARDAGPSAGVPVAVSRCRCPRAGVIDSQSVKTPETRNHGIRRYLRL